MFPQGKPLSLTDLLVRHYDELVRHASGVLRRRDGAAASGSAHQTRDLAREAVHEVCLQLLRGHESAADLRVPLAFLRTLSKRRAIDNLRSEALWRRLASAGDDCPEYLEYAAAGEAEPDRRCYARQQFTLLIQAVESLPPRCRDVFVLHKIHEWTQPRVAEYLGISPKTVEKHIRIGIACCRYALSETLAGASPSDDTAG
ncbi:MAG: sigma-70 family RNA polymerase sigma factor [Rhodocyclaceae bacterium]|nr:sigma-70 family RNA polymerase sigma factor [Rhodocyclaceae bacterium]